MCYPKPPSFLFHLGIGTLLASLVPGVARAAESAPPVVNLLRNGDFEAPPRKVDNTYDGVDMKSLLKVGQIAVRTLAPGGGLSEQRLPPSVALQDLNRDGKPDVVAALPEGFIYVYFNEGEASAPRFTHAEILPIFMSRGIYVDNEFTRSSVKYDRRVPRIGFAEWTKAGTLDLFMGNLFGQLYHIPGVANTPQRVSYSMPKSPASAEIVTTEVEGRYWGNMFSPSAVDWDGDGKMDIVMGEGGYSANSIFLMHNKSTSKPPRFSEADRHFLVTGDGREQLVPALVDYNEDGLTDVLVIDREGKISVHLRPKGWKLGDTLPLSSMISLGEKAELGRAHTLATGDYNGDGLFDLVFGAAGGGILVSVNSGKAGEPQFSTPTPLTGVNNWLENITIPPAWEFSDASSEGNALGYCQVITNESNPGAAVPGGNQCVLLGNFTPLNKLVTPRPTPNMGEGDATFKLRQNVKVEHHAEYTLEFQLKGNKVRSIHYQLAGHVTGKVTGKIVLGSRGEVVSGRSRYDETWSIGQKVNVGPDWQTHSFKFIPKLKDKQLQDVKGWNCDLELSAVLNDEESKLYLDNLRITKK